MPVNEYVKSYPIINNVQKVLSSTLFRIFSFAILTAVAAQISIPVKPVPFTLQTMMVVLAGAFLGARYGAYSQILYLAMGVAGLPVFAQTAEPLIGIARIFGPTGGYLLSFPLAAFVVGLIVERYKNYFSVVTAMFAGNVLILLGGFLYLYTFFVKDLNQAVIAGAVIFSIWTVAKVIISSLIYFSIKKNK